MTSRSQRAAGFLLVACLAGVLLLHHRMPVIGAQHLLVYFGTRHRRPGASIRRDEFGLLGKSGSGG